MRLFGKWGKFFRRHLETEAVRLGKRILFVPRKPSKGWEYGTSLWIVEKNLKFNIREHLRLCSGASGRRAVVLDWGCGTGNALSHLAEEKGLRVAPIGFAKESHKEWAGHKNVNFLQGLPEELPNHFKSNSIDLIFSHNGLNYLSQDGLTNHLVEMHPKLKRNGKIVFNCSNAAVASRMVPFLRQQFRNIFIVEQVKNSATIVLSKKPLKFPKTNRQISPKKD